MLQIIKGKRKGFTLIELLVVIAIIGLLASIITISVIPARKKGNDAKRKSEINQIWLAMELCFDDSRCGGAEKQYPLTDLTLQSIDRDEDPCYLCPLPKDPLGNDYTWRDNTANRKNFCVYTKLESPDTDTWIAARQNDICFELHTEPPDLSCWITCP